MSAGTETPGRARRLTQEARREQLVGVALPIIAEQGLAGFSLDEVASRAEVTRNLLYHYFPRGRRDIALSVVERAGRELTDDWLVDDAVPLEERMAINVSRMIDHGSRPTDAWRIYLLARGARDPELSATVDRFVEIVTSSISLNQIGTPDPPPLVRLALRGYLAFCEAVLDGARANATPPEQILQIFQETLVAAVQAGLAAEQTSRQRGGLKHRSA